MTNLFILKQIDYYLIVFIFVPSYMNFPFMTYLNLHLWIQMLFHFFYEQFLYLQQKVHANSKVAQLLFEFEL